MRVYFFGAVIGLCLSTPALAQEQALDERCPIPYVVGQQSTIAEAYARVTGAIATALPVGNLNSPTLNAFYSNVRSIVAGEAQQALGDVRSAYICRLRATLPESKHAHIALMERELSRMTVGLFLQNNFADFTATNTLFDQLEERAGEALPAWQEIPPADRVTRAEVMAAIGNPDFRSRSETHSGIEATVGQFGAGVCLGTVRATLAAVDNSTIAAMANLGEIMGNLTEDATRFAAYSRLAEAASAVFQPGTSAQIGGQIASANAANRARAQSCMQQASTTVIQNINQSATAVVDSNAQTGGGTPPRPGG